MTKQLFNTKLGVRPGIRHGSDFFYNLQCRNIVHIGSNNINIYLLLLVDYTERNVTGTKNNIVLQISEKQVCVRVFPYWNGLKGKPSKTTCIDMLNDEGMKTMFECLS